MSNDKPLGHNWNRKLKVEEEDPFDKMISRTGCASFHYPVQECMAEHQDWRKCQEQVRSFKDCMMEHEKQWVSELRRRQKQHQATS